MVRFERRNLDRPRRSAIATHWGPRAPRSRAWSREGPAHQGVSSYFTLGAGSPQLVLTERAGALNASGATLRVGPPASPPPEVLSAPPFASLARAGGGARRRRSK
jgi:hypothetical protein